jgi:hypothetical protein
MFSSPAADTIRHVTKEVVERRLGTDRLIDEGDDLVVYAPPMDGWTVRKFRRLAILVEGRRYYVGERRELNPRVVRYQLHRWPDDDTDLAGGELVYDEQFVLERDVAASDRRIRQQQRLLRWALQPLYGFRWEAAKRRAHVAWGFHPRTITKYSLYLQWVLILLLSAWVIFIPTFVYGPIAFLLIDGFFRVAELFRDPEVPYGFYEWLFHWRKTEL